MDPELSNWTPTIGPETDRLSSLISSYGQDMRRVAVAMTDDARRADAAVLATWEWARKHLAALGSGSEARGRLLHRVAREAGRRTRPAWHMRLGARLGWPSGVLLAPDAGHDPEVAAALAPLTVEDRQMLALRLGVGLTSDEIAAQLDLTGPGVRAHLDELRPPLRAALGIEAADERGEPLTAREIDRRIAARLLPHLDRRSAADGRARTPASPLETHATARSVVRKAARPPRFRRRPVILTAVVVLLAAAVALPLILLPPGTGTAEGTPMPSPGTLLAVAGWSQRQVARLDGTVEIIGWAPDGAHVAVAQAAARQIVVYDQRGTAVRTFEGTDAAWVDANRLLVLTSGPNGAYLVLRSVDATGDLLVSWNGQGPPSQIVAGGGSIAVAMTSAGVQTQLLFSVLRDGAFGPGQAGLPLAWTPDGKRLAYLASPTLSSGGYRGRLHVLDIAAKADQDLGVTMVQVGPLAIDPTGRHLLTCAPPTTGAASCVLALVDLADGSVQASSIRGLGAVAAWSPDGSLTVDEDGTVLRWDVGGAPVALRWQPEHGERLLGMAAAGGWFAVGMLHGPAAPQLVAGAQPPMVLLSGPGAYALAATADGRRLAYGQLLRGNTTIVIASLPPAPASPSASATGSPSPAPSAGPSFAGAAMLTLDQTWTADTLPGDTSVSWGPHVYLQSGGFANVNGNQRTVFPISLWVLDITTKAETAIDLPVAEDEITPQIWTDGTHLVVEVFRPLGPPGEPAAPCGTDLIQPKAWRILSAPVGADGVPSGPFSVLDAGTASRVTTPGGQLGVSCATTMLPVVAVADGLAAYAVESPTSANPWGTRVVLRRLSDGTVVRQDVAPAPVPWLSLSGDLLAWTLEPDASVSSTPASSLWVASPLDAPARNIAIPADAATPSSPWFLMAGHALLYANYDPAGAVPPTIWRLDLDTRAAMQLSPPIGRYCSPVGASSEVVFVRCDSESGTSTSFVWRPGRGWIVLDGAIGWFGVMMGGGWVIITDFSGQSPRVIGFPLSELTG